MALSSLDETATHLERARRRKYFTAADQLEAMTRCRRAHFVTNRLLLSKLRQIAAEKADNNRRKRKRR